MFLLGGAEGVPVRAAAALRSRFEGLNIVGTASPPFGFDQTDEGIHRVVTSVASAAPDLVLVGLGFPKQERLIARLREAWPNAWYLACGAGISIAAGDFRRASPLLQRIGLEWAHRLALEPRRLAGRIARRSALHGWAPSPLRGEPLQLGSPVSSGRGVPGHRATVPEAVAHRWQITGAIACDPRRATERPYSRLNRTTGASHWAPSRPATAILRLKKASETRFPAASS